MIPEPLWREIVANVPIICVDVVIVRDGKALLVLRGDPPAKGEWWLPGGRVLKNESLKEAAHRKALEEVGLDCHVGPAIYSVETRFMEEDVQSFNTVYLLWPKVGEEVKLDATCKDFRWVEDKDEMNLDWYVRRSLWEAGF